MESKQENTWKKVQASVFYEQRERKGSAKRILEPQEDVGASSAEIHSSRQDNQLLPPARSRVCSESTTASLWVGVADRQPRACTQVGGQVAKR